MKSIFTALLLLLITIVYCDVFDAIEERACKKQKEEYQGCIEAFNNSTSPVEGTFKVLCSKKCKKYFNDPVKATPKCFSDITDRQKEILDKVKSFYNIDCATDGGDNYCPNTQALIDYKLTENKEEAKDIAIKTCKSKYCTDALIEIYKTSIGKIDYAEEMITFLNSTECREQNSAKALKTGSSLVLTLVALLFILIF